MKKFLALIVAAACALTTAAFAACGDEETDSNSSPVTSGSSNSTSSESTSSESTGGESTGDGETFTYTDKTFGLVWADLIYYVNGVENTEDEAELQAEMEAGGYSITFTFNADGTASYSLSMTGGYILTLSFDYSAEACTTLTFTYFTSYNSIDFTGYQFIFSNITCAEYKQEGEDVDYSDEEAASDMAAIAVGYNDTGMYMLMAFGYSGSGTDGDITIDTYYTIYAQLTEVTE